MYSASYSSFSSSSTFSTPYPVFSASYSSFSSSIPHSPNGTTIDDVFVVVNSLVDSQNPSPNLCNETLYPGTPECNLRSAWSFCGDVDPQALCIIELLPDATYAMDSDFGALKVESGFNIDIIGNLSTIAVNYGDSPPIEGEQAYGNPFPFTTPSMRNTDYGFDGNTQVECVEACVGETVRFSACEAAYSGDPFIWLQNHNTSSFLVSNDDSCGLSSELSYTIVDIDSGCNTYCINMGCYGNSRCSYTMTAYHEAPSTDSFVPTVITEDPWPLYFSESYTYDATENTVDGVYEAAEGDVMTFSTMDYPNYAYSDTYLRLYLDGTEVAFNDDYGGVFTSQITWTAAEAGSYSLHAGCAYYYYCYGWVALSVLNATTMAEMDRYDPRLITYQQDALVLGENETFVSPRVSIDDVKLAYFGSSSISSTGLQYDGGAVYLNGTGDFSFTNVKFFDNRGAFGGHIAVSQNPTGRVSLEGCTLTGGSAHYGGSVYLDTNVTGFSMTNSLIEESTASDGGGIYLNELNPNVYIGGSEIRDCGVSASGGNGGAIFASVGNENFVIENTLVNASAAPGGGGGGIYLDADNHYFTLRNTTVTMCSADQGGGLYVSTGNDHVNILDSDFYGCSALVTNGGSYGGAILVDKYNFNLSIVQSSIHANKASYGGGMASHSDNAGVILAGTSVTNNTATVDGGGVYLVTNHSQFLATDLESYQYTVNFATPHPYMSGPPTDVANGTGTPFVIYNTSIYVPNCTTFLLVFNTLMEINEFDTLYIYRGSSAEDAVESNHVFSSTGNNFPGVTMPTKRVMGVTNHSLWITFTGPANVALYDSNVPKYGLSLNIYPAIDQSLERPFIPTEFVGNRAISGNGGGLMFWSQNPFPVVTNVDFRSNQAKLNGGGLMMKNSNTGAAFQRVVFANNVVGQDGAGSMLSTAHSGVTFQHCTWKDNAADGNGGAFSMNTDNGEGLLREHNNISFSFCNFEGNVATAGNGGAGYVSNDNTVHIQVSNLTANRVPMGQGGAMFSDQNNKLTMLSVLVNENYAKQSGGGLYLARNSKSTFKALSLVGNVAGMGAGGGLYASSDNQIACTGCRADSNIATTLGGGMAFNSDNKAKFSSSEFADNEAESGGGLASETANEFIFTTVIVSGNRATLMGGGFMVKADTSMVFNGYSSFGNNSAGTAGGAIASFECPLWNVTSELNIVVLGAPTAAPTRSSGTTDDMMDDDNQYGYGGSYAGYYYGYNGYYDYFDDDFSYYGDDYVPSYGGTVGAPFPFATGMLSDTSNAEQNTASGCTTGCPGDTLTFSSCTSGANTDYDTYFRLYDSNSGLQVASNDDSCSVSSQISYYVDAAECTVFCLEVGCYGDDSCSTIVDGFNSAIPDTFVGGAVGGSFPLTTGDMSDTSSANQNTVDGCTTGCPGDTLTFSSCTSGANTDYDTYFRLYDSNSGLEVASNDDSCSVSSEISYYVDAAECTTFCLHVGCYSDDSCSTIVDGFNSAIMYIRGDDDIPASTDDYGGGSNDDGSTDDYGGGSNDDGGGSSYGGGVGGSFPLTTGDMSDTSSANQNTVDGCTTGCPGDTLTFSSCTSGANTDYDTYFRLYDSNSGLEVASNDDSCSVSSQISYYVDAAECTVFCLHVGCYGDDSCSTIVDGFNSAIPDTFVGGAVGGSFPLTTGDLSDTDGAREYTVNGCTSGCPGDTLTFSGCGGDTSQDTLFRLFDESTGVEVASNDDSCSYTSEITYAVEASECATYCVHVGCYDMATCSAVVEAFNSAIPYYPDPGSNDDTPASTDDTPASTDDTPASTDDTPASTDDYYSTDDAPASTDDYYSTDDTPASTDDYYSTDDTPVSNDDTPVSNDDIPMNNDDTPASVDDDLFAFGTALGSPFPITTGVLTSTDFALENTANGCTIGCPGDILTFTSCNTGADTFEDTVFRLFESSTGVQVASNDDHCGYSSQIEYAVQAAECTSYCINIGCYDDGSCSTIVAGYNMPATASTDDTPTSTDDTPTSTDDTPASTDDTPASTDDTPASNDDYYNTYDTPASNDDYYSTDDTPVSTDDYYTRRLEEAVVDMPRALPAAVVGQRKALPAAGAITVARPSGAARRQKASGAAVGMPQRSGVAATCGSAAKRAAVAQKVSQMQSILSRSVSVAKPSVAKGVSPSAAKMTTKNAISKKSSKNAGGKAATLSKKTAKGAGAKSGVGAKKTAKGAGAKSGGGAKKTQKSTGAVTTKSHKPQKSAKTSKGFTSSEQKPRRQRKGSKVKVAPTSITGGYGDEENATFYYPITFAENNAERGSAFFFYAVTPSVNSLSGLLISGNNATAGGTTFWLFDEHMEAPPAGLGSDSIAWADNGAPYGPKFATQAVSISGPTSYDVSVYHEAFTPALVFDLTDYYGQNIPLQDVTTVDVTPLLNSSQCLGNEVSIGGSDTIGNGVTVSNGSAVFADLQVVCTPTGNITVDFEAKLGAAAGIEGVVATSYYINAQTRLHFRQCGEGEYTDAGQCMPCADGSYSLVANSSECRSCFGVTGVNFCTEDQVILEKGFFRRYPTTNAVMECPLGVESCMGGNLSGMASCAEGYTGELCSVCAPNYFPQQGTCLKCEGASIVSPSLIAYLIIFVMLLVGTMTSAYIYYGYLKQDEIETARRKVERITAISERAQADFDSDDEHDDEDEEVDENVMRTAAKAGEEEEEEELSAAGRLKVWLGQKKEQVEGVMGKVKIIVSTYQVISSTANVVDVKMPGSFSRLMGSMNFVNLSIGTILPISCTETYTFFDALYFATLLPLAAAAVLICAFVREYSNVRKTIQNNRNRRRGDKGKAFNEIKTKYLSYFFYLTYLVLPSTTTNIFQTFLCTNMDPDGETPGGQNLYLTADMRISCTSDYYYGGVAYACVMVIIYPIGIPMLYLWMLYNAKEEIKNRDRDPEEVAAERRASEVAEAGSEEGLATVDIVNPMMTARASIGSLMPESVKADADTTSVDEASVNVLSLAGEDPSQKHQNVSANTARLGFLWAAYQPEYWYWEVIETTRRLMLTAVLSVVEPGGATQSVLSILLAQFYLKVYGYHMPYGEGSDNTLAEIGQYQIFFTFFAALIIQNDLMGPVWYEGIGVFLILANMGVVLYCFNLESGDHLGEMLEWLRGSADEEQKEIENAKPAPEEEEVNSDDEEIDEADGIQMASFTRRSSADGIQMTSFNRRSSSTSVGEDVL